ncbi:outer spore coat copper-dependent laccase CotA [Bacillus sp. L381]|uniref:outer spore coat copper-dependent laccase CotA n=1 Tax=Bacillus TaxID=1386 RepID=UPI000826E4EB|nr:MULTISPECIES: outer spore coat copper-dependent laccase CotA [Bacillus]AOC90107.1 Spore coat protein [Bacillus amyloliquefaciens]MCR9040389.1 multicopper oxidase family protein [Bacillus velezensis]QUN10175.1 multicopper oxidase family protein [Bacillus amyloliquefaciens]QYM83272.1 multicopper oxidase family protein [Bacillus sp. 7D3]QZY12489.1 multicopper oxidase family protein [Bacillus amyloliquefaciens]
MALEKFADELPIIETLKPQKTSNGSTYYEVTMKECFHKLHRDLPPTRLWGYNGLFPGPTIDVNQDENVYIKWMNDLPDKHFLPVDHTIHHSEGGHQEPDVKTVVHLHGGATPPDSDGYPEAWFTRDFKEKGPYFEKEVYHYPNKQRGALLWYHDHAMAITRLNVYAGLAGMYIIRERKEKQLKLPAGEYDVPLMIMDRTLNDDGSLFYPSGPDNPSETLPNPSIVPFLCGNTILVNGKAWPYMEVEPRTYRFRILNASNTRTFSLSLNNGGRFIQIGSDGGLLPRSVKTQSISLAPAERYDVLIDFSAFDGEHIILTNGTGCGGDVNPDTDANVMQFRVTKPLKGEDTSRKPKYLSAMPDVTSKRIHNIRTLKLTNTQDKYGRPVLTLNNKRWHDPVTEAPQLGSTEIWSIINPTRGTHPIHLHLVSFQVLDRRPFDLERYNKFGDIVYTGPAVPPPPSEKGWKDTVQAHSGEVIRIAATFAPYSGRYVWHCHILEHEDYDMMRPMDVTEKQ